MSVKTTGHEKDHFTVVLACTADGAKLKPMVILKTMPKGNFPDGIVLHVHPKGWMDSDGMFLWFRKVWGLGLVVLSRKGASWCMMRFGRIWSQVS